MDDSLNYLRRILNLKIERELEIESARKILFSISNLDTKFIFSLLDKSTVNSIKSSDLLNFLRSNGILVNENEVTNIILNQTQYLRSELNYDDFLEIIRPVNRCVQNEEETNKMIQLGLVNIFEKILESNRIFQKDIKINPPRLKLFDAFEIIADNKYQNNLITLQSFYNFLNSDKSKKEVKYIIKRYDNDNDNALSIEEFSNLLTPFFQNGLNISSEKSFENDILEKDELKLTLENLNHNIGKIITKMDTQQKSKHTVKKEIKHKKEEKDFYQKKNLLDKKPTSFNSLTEDQNEIQLEKNSLKSNPIKINSQFSGLKKQFPSIIQEFPSEEDKVSILWKSNSNLQLSGSQNEPELIPLDYTTGIVDLSFEGSPNKKAQTGFCFDPSINEKLLKDKSYREMIDNYIFRYGIDSKNNNPSLEKNEVKKYKHINCTNKGKPIKSTGSLINEEYNDSLEGNISESSNKLTDGNNNIDYDDSLERDYHSKKVFENKVLSTPYNYSQEIEIMPTTAQKDSFALQNKKNPSENSTSQEIVTENLGNINILQFFLLVQLDRLIQIERAQKTLNNCEDFSLVSCFKIFDAFRENKISQNSFQKGCSKIGLIVEEKDIYLLMKRYDKDNDGFLSFNEFAEMLILYDIENSGFLNKKNVKSSKSSKREMSPNTKKCVSTIIQLLIDREMKNFEEKVKLVSDPSWDYELFFKEIATENEEYFTDENLRKYLEINDYGDELNNEIALLFNHYDKDGDMKVYLDDFVEELST